MKMLTIKIVGNDVKLQVVKTLAHGFYLTKPNKKIQKKYGIRGPYQVTHVSGARLAHSSNLEALEGFYLAVVANPTIQAALTEMTKCHDDQYEACKVWILHYSTIDLALRNGMVAFKDEIELG
jgi:hypothetical protein